MGPQPSTAAGDGVDLVDEDDRWTVGPGPFEEAADVAGRLAHPLAQDVGAGDRVEGAASLGGEDLGDGGLPRAGWTSEQQPTRRVDAEAARRLRVLDHGLELLQLGLHGWGQDQRVPRPVLDRRPVLPSMAFDGGEEVLGTDLQVLAGLLGLPEHLEGGAVDDLGDGRRRHPLGAPDELVEVNLHCRRAVVELGLEDGASGLGVGQVDAHVAVEAAGADDGRVEAFEGVGGSQ